MDEQMTKARLLETMHRARAEWDGLLAEFSDEDLVEPGVSGAWSIKDIVAHITAYERWLSDRFQEQVSGERYSPSALDLLDFDERNEQIYQLNRDRPLQEVLAESRDVFQRLFTTIDALPEEFLLQPRRYEGIPLAVAPWMYLRSESYGHYAEHMPAIQARADQRRRARRSSGKKGARPPRKS